MDAPKKSRAEEAKLIEEIRATFCGHEVWTPSVDAEDSDTELEDVKDCEKTPSQPAVTPTKDSNLDQLPSKDQKKPVQNVVTPYVFTSTRDRKPGNVESGSLVPFGDKFDTAKNNTRFLPDRSVDRDALSPRWGGKEKDDLQVDLISSGADLDTSGSQLKDLIRDGEISVWKLVDMIRDRNISVIQLGELIRDEHISKKQLGDLIRHGDISKRQLGELIHQENISKRQLKDLIRHGDISVWRLTDMIRDGYVSDSQLGDLIRDGDISKSQLGDLIRHGDIRERQLVDLIRHGDISKSQLGDLIRHGDIRESQLVDLIRHGDISISQLGDLIRHGDISERQLGDLIRHGDISKNQLEELKRNGDISDSQLARRGDISERQPANRGRHGDIRFGGPFEQSREPHGFRGTRRGQELPGIFGRTDRFASSDRDRQVMAEMAVKLIRANLSRDRPREDRSAIMFDDDDELN